MDHSATHHVASLFWMISPKGAELTTSDGMTLKVLLKLLACHEDPTHKLLPVWIPLFGLDKHLTDVVNRPLNRVLLASLFPFHHDGYTDGPAISSHI